MLPLILTTLAVGVLLVLNEAWWRKLQHHSELSRKFIHITVGSFVAVWPFFLSWNQIILLSGAFLVVVGISKYLHVFKAIHSVQRPTWGELFFALAVGIIAFVTHHKGLYAVSLLQMSLADGLAAIVGMRFGNSNRYQVFGSTKSLIGTLTFFIVSLSLLFAYVQYSGAAIAWPVLIALAAGTSLIENLGVYGLDNLLVPLTIAYILSLG